VRERVSAGIPEIDALTGGLPRGAITEIFGPVSSGRTSVMLAIFAEAASRGEALALVDGSDAFDPESAALAGLDLKRLLWVRCRNLDQALKSADLLLQGGGFGLVAMDLTDTPLRHLRSVPLASWFRFQRTIENTPAILVITGQEAAAKPAAALALRLDACHADWTNPSQAPAHSVLLRPVRPKAEVVRCRQGAALFAPPAFGK
jgi:hypothetical protein